LKVIVKESVPRAFEKLRVQTKKISYFYIIFALIMFQQSPAVDLILKYFTDVHIAHPLLFSAVFSNAILPYMPRSPSRLLP
jgi:hypothetical protein